MPKQEIECLQVIFGDLSNFQIPDQKLQGFYDIKFWLTEYGGVSKKDVDDGNVLFICTVGHLFLKKYGKWDFMFSDLKFALPWY